MRFKQAAWLLVLTGLGSWIFAQCVSTSRQVGQVVPDTIQLIPQGDWPSNMSYILQNAMDMWNRSQCNTTGYSFPRFPTATTDPYARKI